MKFSNPAQTWDKRYESSEQPLFGAEPNIWLTETSHWLSANSQIVCIADGQGRNGLYLASQGHRVTSFDISPVAVNTVRADASRRGVSIDASVSDLESWAWQDDSLDAVVAVFIQFAGPDERARLFANIGRAIKPGGTLIIEGYGRRQLTYRTGGPGILENLYSMPLLCEAFTGWQMLASRDADLDLAEGTGHHGRSHVISAVLRRPDQMRSARRR